MSRVRVNQRTGQFPGHVDEMGRTCPHCGDLNSYNALWCECGSNLTEQVARRKNEPCQYCGRRTKRRAANGKPCCAYCDDLPGKEPL